MKPVFCNTFNITHNKAKSEIAISFNHVYTEHNFVVDNAGALTDVSAQVCDSIASVLVTRDGAVALSRLLNHIVSSWGIEPE